jgi:hypothetical protein
MFYLEPPTCDDRLFWDVSLSDLQGVTLSLADELGLFPLLAGGACEREEIGRRLSLHPRACEALLAVLTGLGILAQHEGRFSLTPVARNFLLPDSPYYRGILFQDREFPRYKRLREAVLRDRDRDRIPGSWETGELVTEDARPFAERMHVQSLPTALGLARWGDFTGVRHLLDVGGGSGCFCIALAARYPQMRFTILELPAVCPIAQEYIASAGLQERIETYPANMFRDPWPSGADAIFFSNVFHDWDGDQCLDLGRRSFAALPPGGRIYLHEALLSDTRDAPLTVALFSMSMLLVSEGKQFSAGELRELLEECGFLDVSVTPTYGYYSLTMGRKPDREGWNQGDPVPHGVGER